MCFVVNNEKTLLIGSSHMVRMRHAFITGQLPNSGQYICHGYPGTPLWNPHVFNNTKQEVEKHGIEKVVLFVPDLRFGNVVDIKILQKYDLIGGVTHIKKEHINLMKDLALAAKSVQVLALYLKALPVKTDIFYYDLFFREVFDAANGRYHNTLYTLKNFEGYLSTHTYKLHHQKPLGDFSCLICDSSLHPSNHGFLSLFHILHHQESSVKNYDIAMQAAKDNLKRRLSAKMEMLPPGTLICGDSIFMRDLSDQLGIGKIEELHSKKIYLYSAPPQSTDMLDEVAVLTKRYRVKNIFFVSSFHSKTITEIYSEGKRIKYLLSSLCRGAILYLPYELIAREIISRRHTDLSKYKDLQPGDWKNVLSFLGLQPSVFNDGFVQIGVFLHPYLKAYDYFLGNFGKLCSQFQ